MTMIKIRQQQYKRLKFQVLLLQFHGTMTSTFLRKLKKQETQFICLCLHTCSQCLLMHSTTTVLHHHRTDGDNFSNVFNNRINKLDDVTPVTLINWPNTCYFFKEVSETKHSICITYLFGWTQLIILRNTTTQMFRNF